MKRLSIRSIFLASLCLSLPVVAPVVEARPQEQAPGQAVASAGSLATAPSDELLKVYVQLRQLKAGDLGAVAENVAWKRDAGTFTFKSGKLTFAAPVAGRVLAAVFTGQGIFELDPPTGTDKRQIARFTKQPKLEDGFREAVFLFTDESFDELQKLVMVRAGGAEPGAAKILESAQKNYQQHFNDWWENHARGYFPIHNIAARMLADLTDPASKGFFLADISSEHYDRLFYHISWNRDGLLSPGLNNEEEVVLEHHKGGQYSEWWSGFHLGAEYARTPHPEHRVLVAHCRKENIDAEVSKSNHLSATAEMEFEVPGGTLRVLALNLEGVLRIDSVADGAGGKLSFIQEDRKLDSDPSVVLPQPAAAGQTYSIKISYREDSTYESRIVKQQGSGLYFVGARESWFPSFGAFDDRTLFSLYFRSPKRFKFVATGRNLRMEKTTDSVESFWESEIPYSAVGFNYGDFVEKSQEDKTLTVTAYAGREVPDELKALGHAIDTAELAQGPGHGNLEAQYGIARGGFNTAANAQYAAAQSFQAFKLFEYYFGALPFKTISVTEQPQGFFGQSWPTLIYLPYLSLLDSTTRNSLRLSDTAEEREFFNLVAIHEMSHQWWGHMVGWKTYHDEWLSEGFAEFSAALYLKQFEPKKLRGFWDLRRRHLLQTDRAGHRPVDVGPLWLNGQTSAYLEREVRRILVYEKGAYVLEMLRMLMEDPSAKNSDARFIAMMREFVSTYTAKNASTADFQRVVEKHAQQPMDWFFNEWVYGTEVPHYEFSYDLKDAGQGKTTLRVSLAQSGVSDDFSMRVPLYLYVNGSARRLGFLTIKGSSGFSHDILLPLRPEKVTIDEGHSLLCTEKQ